MKQAKVTTQYEALRGIFDLGDKVKIEILRYEKDTVIHEDIYAVYSKNEKVNFAIVDSSNRNAVKIFDKLVAPKGSYKGYSIKSKNGNYYDDGCIRNFIGYKSLGEIFTLTKNNKS